MSYGPGQAMGEVMESVTKGIFPWDQGDYRSAGKMTDVALQGMAAGAAVIIVVAIIVITFLVSVYIRRAFRKSTKVAEILWWTLGIFAGCVTLGLLLILSDMNEPAGWYLSAWAFFGLCVSVTACELYSMQYDRMEIASEDLDKYLHSFSP